MDGDAEAVRQEVLSLLESGTYLTNGAKALRAWTTTEDERPVLYVVYRHPWWDFTTGLRRYVDDYSAERLLQTESAADIAGWIAEFDIGEPLGIVARSMVPDDDDVWWWGDPPFPAHEWRRGPAPGT